ncbi:MAG TPA: hypothetical protein VNI36_05825 [Candidatus Dormibacteraeota bacterium]|nr:hypothetical protein [Candidatus Dormibacteraeota bacterium]
MIRMKPILVLTTAMFAALACVAISGTALWATNQGATVTGNPVPTAAQIRSLFVRVIENQHRNDQALQEYERVERVITYTDANAHIVSEHTDRVLFSGTGTMKIRISENGSPVSPQVLRDEMQEAVRALNLALHPDEHFRQDLAKYQRRRRERAELLDEAMKAFRATWVGRETRRDPYAPNGSRTLTKFLLDPDPNYTPNSRFGTVFQHVHAVIWVDENQEQIARAEGNITSDISFFAGIAGKIYHGGHFVMEQSEVSPGVWLPTLYIYNVDGRKFLFGFGVHERTEISHYRRVGPPSQAIEILRKELNNLTAQSPAN